jgi:glutamyl-tRNA reductase
MSRLHLLGLNHKTAPVEVRERFALPAARLEHAHSYVRAVEGVEECAIVSTCNRVEIYIWGSDDAGQRLRRAMNAPHALGGGHFDEHLYLQTGQDAAHHLFQVASGLDSLVLGESEILGQVKVAIQHARESGSAGRHLDELFRRAIACGKRARSETGISRGAQSVGAAAVELARQIFGSLSGQTVLILGAGKMSARVAQCLVSSGARRVLVSNRTFDRAQELAQTWSDDGLNTCAVTWDEFPRYLSEADIVIASTRAPGYILTPAQLAPAMKGRRRPLLLVDIAVPRDIDPACSRFDDAFCFDVDDLQNVVMRGAQARRSEVAGVETIIEQELSAWTNWERSSGSRGALAALAGHANQVRDSEVQTALAKLEHLSARDRAVVESLARAVAGKLMHAPLAHLRSGGEDDAGALLRAFGLRGEQSHEREA